MKIFFTLCLSLGIWACSGPASTHDVLSRFCEEASCDFGSRMGYVNSSGDTVVAAGRYAYCYTDTIRNIGFVLDTNRVCLAIDNRGRELYQVYWFDNGPDYLSDGLFRMMRDSLIGYADSAGRIVIRPQYKCAGPFRQGRARVSYDCRLQKEGEHTLMQSTAWFFIDKKRNKLK